MKSESIRTIERQAQVNVRKQIWVSRRSELQKAVRGAIAESVGSFTSLGIVGFFVMGFIRWLAWSEEFNSAKWPPQHLLPVPNWFVYTSYGFIGLYVLFVSTHLVKLVFRSYKKAMTISLKSFDMAPSHIIPRFLEEQLLAVEAEYLGDMSVFAIDKQFVLDELKGSRVLSERIRFHKIHQYGLKPGQSPDYLTEAQEMLDASIQKLELMRAESEGFEARVRASLCECRTYVEKLLPSLKDIELIREVHARVKRANALESVIYAHLDQSIANFGQSLANLHAEVAAHQNARALTVVRLADSGNVLRDLGMIDSTFGVVANQQVTFEQNKRS